MNNKLDNSRCPTDLPNQNTETNKKSEDYLNGFTLHLFENERPNLYKHKSLTFQHPHKETSKEWINKLKELLSS